MSIPRACQWARRCFVASAVAALAFASALADGALGFRISEGNNINEFTRHGPVAAHLVLRAGTAPRIHVAFPAGNSGVGVWFVKTDTPVAWTLTSASRPIHRNDARGRPLHGIEAEVATDATALNVEQAVLSSTRVLRDYEALRSMPPEVSIAPRMEGDRIVWSRDRLDGAPGYELTLQSSGDANITPHVITRGARGPLRLKITALTGEPPLTGLSETSLLTSSAAADRRARNALSFLSYEEKYLAGSWRFNTYFGRDTLMSLALLGPVLQPQAIENGLASVLVRLAPNGEVAHEEDIAEFAILRNVKEGRGRVDAPIYDYGMVDDDFMLLPVATDWLLDAGTGRSRAAAFLAKRAANGERHGDALVRNAVWVVERTVAFADDPRQPNLLAIKDGRTTGQWRDSNEGLGFGRYAYDVNAVFVPAALAAIARLMEREVLDPYLSAQQRMTLQRARMQAEIWSKQAPPLFAVSIPPERVRPQVSAYAAAIGVKSPQALDALGSGPAQFMALALDVNGKPVPVMHSDEGFALLFSSPPPTAVEHAVTAMMRPFPAGLLTPAGLLVANPVFADRSLQGLFTNAAYHGTVVWSWQQAVLAAGLERQLDRSDLPPPLRSKLMTAREQLVAVIKATAPLRTSELWTWSYANNSWQAVPFGQHGAHADESNAAQLWGTVFLTRQW